MSKHTGSILGGVVIVAVVLAAMMLLPQAIEAEQYHSAYTVSYEVAND